MFKKERLKLTLQYLIIIMSVSVLFSCLVYHLSVQEVARGMRLQIMRSLRENDLPPERFFASPALPPNFHLKTFEEAKERIATELILINLGILMISGAAGYFLAGKTLFPIAQMLEEQKRFVADASHELRTPLTSIKTETEVALRDEELNVKEAKKILKSNLEEVDKLKSLTDYFLTLSKYQSSIKAGFKFEKVALREAVETAAARLTKPAGKKKIKIKKSLAEVFALANKTSIVELVSILLDNAIKYSPSGKNVILQLTKHGNHAQITVQDFGMGISQEDIPLIFNRFYRASPARTKIEADSYGLGLSIAKSIIELHHGKVSVKSAIGQGSTFSVLLPA